MLLALLCFLTTNNSYYKNFVVTNYLEKMKLRFIYSEHFSILTDNINDFTIYFLVVKFKILACTR